MFHCSLSDYKSIVSTCLLLVCRNKSDFLCWFSTLQPFWALVFRILLFSSLSLHFSLKKAFLFLLAILWNSTFSWVYLSLSPLPLASLFPQQFVSPPHTTTLLSCISFSLEWFWSPPPVQCYVSPSIVLQALYLSDLTSWIYVTSTVQP